MKERTADITASEKAIFEKLLSRDNVAVFIHRSPDGDAVGTAFALKRVLEKLGRRVCVACSDSIPKRLDFLADGKTELELEFEPQTVVSVDVATEGLFGKKYGEYSAKTEFAIDHHITNTRYAENLILHHDHSSAGELLFRLLKACGVEIDDYIAEKLYAAISFDTGCFKFSNVGCATFECAAELVCYDFHPEQINRRLFDIATLERLKAENMLLMNAETYFGGRVAVACITRELLNEYGLTDSDADGLVTVLRRIDGSDISFAVRETEDGTVRVSLRSECDFDVSALAARFGGGGHVKASGCSFECDIQSAKSQLLCATAEALGIKDDNNN